MTVYVYEVSGPEYFGDQHKHGRNSGVKFLAPFFSPASYLCPSPFLSTQQDDEFAETLKLCDETSPYGLTGSIFARDRVAVAKASAALRYATGNFYINDK